MIKRYTNIVIILICTFITLGNFSFASENNEKNEYEIQSALRTTNYIKWIERDKKYLQALSKKDNLSTSKIYKEINILNKELNKIKDNYFIKTNSKARIYSSQVTGCIHAINNGIKNRYSLLDDKANFEYSDEFLTIDLYPEDTRRIEKNNGKFDLIDDDVADAMLRFTIDILNKDTELVNITNNVYVYMSPYKIEEIHASISMSTTPTMKKAEHNYIVISTPLAYEIFLDGVDYEKLLPLYSIVLYHEIGHLFLKTYVNDNSISLTDLQFNLRNGFENMNLDITNDYKNLIKDNTSFKTEHNMEERFCDAFGYYYTKKHININDDKYIISQYFLKRYLFEDYIDDKFDSYFFKYIKNFISKNKLDYSLPVISLDTKEVKSIKNNNTPYTVTNSNIMTLKVDESSINTLGDNRISIKLIPLNSKWSKMGFEIYIGKLNKENLSKTVFILNGLYTIKLEYRDKNTNKNIILNNYVINIK